VLHWRAALLLLLLTAPFADPVSAAAPPDTIVMGKGIDDIVSLDPAEAYEFSGAEVIGNVYDRLIEGDPQDPAQVRPGLAESWSNDASGHVFTFKLRRRARFASGAPVTAGDAAFSLQRAVMLDKAPALVLRQLGLTRNNAAARIRAEDDGTLVIETPRVLAPSLVYFCLTSSVASIVERREVLAHEEEGDLGNGWLSGHSAGSGPYRLRLWRPAERYVLDANPDYWAGAPANRHVFVRQVKEAATQRLMLLRGDIDYARDLDKDQLAAIARDPALRIDHSVQSLVTYLAFNQRNPYLRRPQVITALKYLIDYDGIAKAILGGTRVVHEAFEPEGYLGAIDDHPFRYDPARAKALLASAGLAAGFAVTIDVRNASPWTEVAQALQSGFSEAGIALTIIPGDGKQVLTKYRARHHDIFLGEWGTDYPDPHSNAEAFALNEDNSDAAPKKTPAWRNAWSDPAMNARVAAAMTEQDTARRAQLYRDLQRAHQQVAPFAFMFEFVATAAHPATVDGLLLGAGPIETRYGGIARH
jgi:peptide/nickel transport system substrate-binding protein